MELLRILLEISELVMMMISKIEGLLMKFHLI